MTLHRILGRCLLSVLAAVAGITANAAPPTFQISQVFSNLDGTVQFIRLDETAGLNGQHLFAGLTLTSTHGGNVRTFTFPNDLPTDQTAHLSVVVAAAHVLPPRPTPTILTFGQCFGNLRCVINFLPDFIVPSRFLATDGGTIDFAGIDQVAYASLPVDGAMGLSRDGTVRQATLPKGVCPGSPPGCPPVTRLIASLVTAIEYYNAARDHYFVTASAPDIDALDQGRFPGWQRTGESFAVAPGAFTQLGIGLFLGAGPVCRFYIPPSEGDSHFFSASPGECEEVHERFPEFVLESNSAFYVTLPDPKTGRCPPISSEFGSDYDVLRVAVFRLWNQRADSNHRYTTNVFTRNLMIQRGYVAEGYGPSGVAFCVPPFGAR